MTSAPRHEPLALDAAGRELDLPARAEAAGGQAERDLLVMRVEEEQERLVAHRLAALRLRGELVAVQEDADRARIAVSQSRRVMRRPSGRIHQTSGSCSPLPSKNFVRRKTGCALAARSGGA